MNDELLKRLAEKRGSVVRPVPRTVDTSDPLNYRSPPAEVEAWLANKGFSPELGEHLLRKRTFKRAHYYHGFYHSACTAHAGFMCKL